MNLGAGSIIANGRNELSEPEITFMHDGALIETGAGKFRALAGDGVRVGANAVMLQGRSWPAEPSSDAWPSNPWVET